MSPKEKAEELVNELFERSLAYHDACIAATFFTEQIDEILMEQNANDSEFKYWREVKSEIENL